MVMVRDCNVSNNVVGVESNGSPAIVRITKSTITANGTGLLTFGGSLISFGDNSLAGNTTDGAPTSTIVLK